MKPGLKSTLLPLALLWLAAHALILGVILGLKFLAAKTVLLLAVIGAGAWYLLKHNRPQRLPAA